MDNLIESFKLELTKSGFGGDFHTDYPNRLINATDNSIYELLPQAVVQPLNANDVELILKIATLDSFKTLEFSPRGGGTGTNGQSLSNKIIIDFSRHMTKILEFNLANMTVTVEPGIILSDLNRFLAPKGLFFAPDVSTANRATIGGMIANDAAGKGSFIYGKTSDHVINLDLILADGSKISTQSLDIKQLNSLPETKTTKLYKEIISYLEPVQDEIGKRFPPLKRPLSGYNIKKCYIDGKFDLSRLICGSEGTLGLVVAATLKLTRIPKYKTLVIIHYDSFIEALKDAMFLANYHPLAIETVDEKVQKSAQSLPNWPILAKMLNSVDKNYISNFMELVDDDSESLDKRIKQLTTDLDSRTSNYVVVNDSFQIAQLWSIRSLAVGLASKIPGVAKPIAFVEDAIVPIEHLPEFVEDLEEMLNHKKRKYAMYGHVDVGCIHVRPALDMQNKSDRALIRPITEDVIEILKKYNGILWGEHGKGFRGEFVPEVFGPILYPILCKIKSLFDPNNRLNTGKLSSVNSLDKLTRIEQVPMRGQFDEIIPKLKQEQYTGAMLCNGNAACFNNEPTNVMCPSYKITRDRVHSPKGRAMLVKEWLREKSKPLGRDKEVAKMAFDAMNGCLSCKGCTGKCPTGVSIPDLRTKFLNEYHKEYKKRTLREYLSCYTENILVIFAKFPRLWNFVVGSKLLSSFGMNDLPTFSLESKKKLKNISVYSNVSQIDEFKENAIVIYADPFTGLIEPNVLLAFIDTVKKMEMTPYVILPTPSGKAFIVGGMIDKFRTNIEKLAKLFNPVMNKKIPIVSLENSLALMFRDEVNKFAKPFSGNVLTIAEFMSLNIDKISNIKINGDYLLLPHCTEQAIYPLEATNWKNIFSKLGGALEIKNLGCCGMAGSYGHQKENQRNSEGLYNMNWKESIKDNVLATGFSCRSQSMRFTDIKIHHPIEIISRSLAL